MFHGDYHGSTETVTRTHHTLIAHARATAPQILAEKMQARMMRDVNTQFLEVTQELSDWEELSTVRTG